MKRPLMPCKCICQEDRYVSDNGMRHLKRLTGLRHLYLTDTKVTKAGCDALRKALPMCDINSGDDFRVDETGRNGG